ncbi:MAG: redoxin domain-containing protein [Candidatus Brocadiaceae bacterium]
MNKKLLKIGITFMVALTLFVAASNSFANGSIKRIKFSELNSILESNKGKVVVVDLWATWCPPCRKEIPGFVNIYAKYREKGVEVIGIAYDEKGEEVLPPFMNKMGINYPVYLDGGGIAEAYDLRAYPTTIVYGKDGKVASKHVGFVPENEFNDEIGELLKK